MARKKSILLAGNWKMNHGPKATREFLEALQVPEKHGVPAVAQTDARMRIYTPYLSLTTALEVSRSRNLPLEIGAQNIHFEKSGAFTGEISGPMLEEIGIRQVLIGHSERRQFFGETDETVLKRAESALSQGFEVLLCIGELLAERQAGRTEAVLGEQLRRILQSASCSEAFGTRLHLAYEPVWAIGTGVVATPEQAEGAHAHIRGLLGSALGDGKAQQTRILYGGSVTPANFGELLACSQIDGGLVGGASLKPESWQALWRLI
ncbi:triose-phosphate isomerase [bacterium]|jgi:triosephosphate isomerase|nr:triose-phosphate isomerase [bacterium]